MGLEPQMDAGLVADLDHGPQGWFEGGGGAADDGVLGVPGEIGAIEIGEIIVFHAVLGRPAGEVVPDRLIDGAGEHHPVGQVQITGDGEDAHQAGRRAKDAAHAPFEVVHASLRGQAWSRGPWPAPKPGARRIASAV